MKIKTKNIRGELKLREFPSLEGIDTYRFLTHYNCPVEMDNENIVLSEKDYYDLYRLLHTYKCANERIELVREIDKLYADYLRDSSEEFLAKGDIVGCTKFIIDHITKWEEEYLPYLIE